MGRRTPTGNWNGKCCWPLFQGTRAVSGVVIDANTTQITFTPCVHVNTTTGVQVNIADSGWSSVSGFSDLSPTVVLFTHAFPVSDGDTVRWRYLGGTDSLVDCDKGEDIGAQEISVTNPIDTVDPFITFAEVGNEGSNIFHLTFSEAITSQSGDYSLGWSIAADAVPLTVTANTFETPAELYLTTTEFVTEGQTVLVSYNRAAGDIYDVTGYPDPNPLQNVTDHGVQNSVGTGPDVELPQVTDFHINGDNAVSTSRTISVDALTGTDNVTAAADLMYMVNNSPDNPPAPGDARWVAYTDRLDDLVLVSDGAVTVTAYVKDEADNVSRGIGNAQIVLTVDSVAPTVSNGRVNNAGVLLTINLSEAITGDQGFTLTQDGQAVALSNPQHPTTARITFTTAQVYQGTILLLSYAAGDVADASGNPLADFNSFAVTNSSTAEEPDVAPPVFQSAAMAPDTDIMTPVLVGDGPMTVGRDTDIWLPDYQGVYQQFSAGEVGWSGGRVTGAVGSRVVYGTDSGGQPLLEMPYLTHAPQSTNINTLSRDLRTWGLSGGIVITYDQVGLAGEPNTASLLDDSVTDQWTNVSSNVPTLCTADSNAMSMRCYVGKDDNATVFVELRATGYQNTFVQLNTSTGAILQRFGEGRSSVRSVGDWWAVTIEQTKDGVARTQQVLIFPAIGTEWGGTGSQAATRSCVIGQVDIFDNTPLEIAETLPPIFTEGAAVSRSADVNSVPNSNHDETNAAIYCEMVSGLGSALTSTDNDLIVGNPAVTNQRCLRRTRHALASATTGTTAESITGDMDNGGINKVGLVYDNTTGKMRVCVDGAWGLEVTDYVGVPITVYQILGNIAGVAATNKIRDLREYRGTYEALTAVIDGLMA